MRHRRPWSFVFRRRTVTLCSPALSRLVAQTMLTCMCRTTTDLAGRASWMFLPVRALPRTHHWHFHCVMYAHGCCDMLDCPLSLLSRASIALSPPHSYTFAGPMFGKFSVDEMTSIVQYSLQQSTGVEISVTLTRHRPSRSVQGKTAVSIVVTLLLPRRVPLPIMFVSGNSGTGTGIENLMSLVSTRTRYCSCISLLARS